MNKFFDFLSKIPLSFYVSLIFAIFCYTFWRKYRGASFKVQVQTELGQEEKVSKEVILENLFLGAFLVFFVFFLIVGLSTLRDALKKEGKFFPPELLREDIAPWPPKVKKAFPLPPKISTSTLYIQVE